MDESLRNYIETNILPLYDGFDAAHQRNHVDMVIEQSMAIARLNTLREIIKNEPLLREKFDYLYEALTNPHFIGCTCSQCQPTK